MGFGEEIISNTVYILQMVGFGVGCIGQKIKLEGKKKIIIVILISFAVSTLYLVQLVKTFQNYSKYQSVYVNGKCLYIMKEGYEIIEKECQLKKNLCFIVFMANYPIMLTLISGLIWIMIHLGFSITLGYKEYALEKYINSVNPKILVKEQQKYILYSQKSILNFETFLLHLEYQFLFISAPTFIVQQGEACQIPFDFIFIGYINAYYFYYAIVILTSLLGLVLFWYSIKTNNFSPAITSMIAPTFIIIMFKKLILGYNFKGFKMNRLLNYILHILLMLFIFFLGIFILIPFVGQIYFLAASIYNNMLVLIVLFSLGSVIDLISMFFTLKKYINYEQDYIFISMGIQHIERNIRINDLIGEIKQIKKEVTNYQIDYQIREKDKEIRLQDKIEEMSKLIKQNKENLQIMEQQLKFELRLIISKGFNMIKNKIEYDEKELERLKRSDKEIMRDIDNILLKLNEKSQYK